MTFTKNFTTGILIGAGTAMVGFYIYQKNKSKVDNFLRDQGMNIPVSGGKDYSQMSLQELVETKEHIEDLIAEAEAATETEANEAAVEVQQ